MAKKMFCFRTFLGISILFLLMSGSICSADPGTGAAVGNVMPQFTLNALNGQGITVAPSDKITILNFWATWCPPCRGEMPELNDFFGEYGDKVVFYAINLREEAGFVNDFMYKNGYSIPTLLDSNGETGNLFQIKFVPTTIVVDRSGIIRFRKSGAITKTELENVVKSI